MSLGRIHLSFILKPFAQTLDLLHEFFAFIALLLLEGDGDEEYDDDIFFHSNYNYDEEIWQQ